LELKEKVEEGLYEYSNDHYYIDYSYVLDNTKTFLKKSQKYILKLKEMLKEQKESNKTQVDKKEEDTTRLNNEKEEREVDDEISKIFETIVHLKTLLEILSLMSTVEVMICNDEVHQLRLSLMSIGISVIRRCQLCGEIDNASSGGGVNNRRELYEDQSSELQKYFVSIVDPDRINNPMIKPWEG
jgi:hypothetical protein